MKHRRVTRTLLKALGLIFAAALSGQKVEHRGQAWLDARTGPAAINVNGAWHAGQWGLVTLNQADGSREVTGTGDGWDILGVVSGTKVCLLFLNKGSVAYSAELTPDGPDALGGRYADGLLTERSRTRLMHFTK
jgi:hypothetical protein